MAPSTAKHLRKFTKILNQLLGTLHDVFPGCEATADASLKFLAGSAEESVQKKAISKWHRSLRPYYTACEKGEWDKVFDTCDNEMFRKLSLKSKWATLDDGSKANLVQYIEALNKHAIGYFQKMMDGVCSSFPPKMLERMQAVAADIAEGAASNGGALDMQNFKLDEIGQRVFGDGGMDGDELEQFGSAIPQMLPALVEMTQSLLGDNNIVSQLGSLLNKQ